MTVSLALLVAMAVLYACGVYLLLEKSMTRVILGVLLVGNATNLLLLIMSGPSGSAPIVDGQEAGSFSDPVPQALILTAIVITFAVSAFLMALVYRSWRIGQLDEVQLDEEDVALASRRAEALEEPDRGDPDDDEPRAETETADAVLDEEETR